MDLGVLDASPEAGDAEAVDGLVAGFVARAERFAARAVAVRAAGADLVGVSAGAWAQALGERSAGLVAGWDDAAGGCRQVAAVLAEYAAGLRDLRSAVVRCRAEVDDGRVRAVAARERYVAAVLAAGGARAGWSWTDVPAFPAVPSAVDELRVWRAAVGRVSGAVREFERQVTARQDLDRRTAAALAGTQVMAAYAPGTGVDAVVDVPVVRALTAVGIGTAGSQEAQLLVAWFEQAVARVGDVPVDVAALDAVTDFLGSWGHDPGGGRFAAVGGALVLEEALLRWQDAVLAGELLGSGHVDDDGVSVCLGAYTARRNPGSKKCAAQGENSPDRRHEETASTSTASIVHVPSANERLACPLRARTTSKVCRSQVRRWSRERGSRLGARSSLFSLPSTSCTRLSRWRLPGRRPKGSAPSSIVCDPSRPWSSFTRPG